MKIFVSILILFFTCVCESREFCTVDNILVYDYKKKPCIENELLFGYLTFKSNKRNLNFILDKDLDIKTPDIFRNEIKTFIKLTCKKEKKTLKLKTITNFDKYNNIYVHKIIRFLQHFP